MQQLLKMLPRQKEKGENTLAFPFLPPSNRLSSFGKARAGSLLTWEVLENAVSRSQSHFDTEQRRRNIDLGSWTGPRASEKFPCSLLDTHSLGCHYSRAAMSFLPRTHSDLNYKFNVYIYNENISKIGYFFQGTRRHI